MRNASLFRIVLIGAMACVPWTSVADSITVGGITYAPAYVRESPQRYYVQIPDTGKTLSFSKKEVRPEDVQISPDPVERERILKDWQAKSAPVAPPPPSSNPTPSIVPAPHAAQPEPSAPEPTEDSVPGIKMKNVKLRDALKTMLRQQNLDFDVRNGQIWVSTPEGLRTQSFENVETRVYTPKGMAQSGTLPKVILQTTSQTGLYSNGSAAVMGGTSPQYSGGGIAQPGNTGYGGNMQMQGYSPMNGAGGGAMYGGGMQGGYGGGYGQGYGGGMTSYGNIVDLVRPFDDRIVGETPAAPGMLMFVSVP